MIALRKSKRETLSDRLPYFGIDSKSQAIWLKDGSATLSLKVVPKDCSQMTDDELETLRGGLIPILNHLPEGSVLQALLMRDRSTKESDETFRRWLATHTDRDSNQKARQALFEARKEKIDREFEAGNIFQTRCYLTLRILPDLDPKPGKNLGPFSHLGFRLQGNKASLRNRNQIIEALTDAFDTLSVGLSALGFEIAQVPHEERVQVIYEWLNPERSKALPSPTAGSATILSDQVGLTDLVETRSGLSLGRTAVEIASLKSLPEISLPALMQDLACAAIPFSMLLTIYVLPQTQERERLMRKQRLAQGMASGNAVRNLMAEAQLRDIEDTLGALISSGEKIFGVSFHIVGIKETQ